MKKRLSAAVLAAILLVCLLPTSALAAGESGIQLGTSGLGTDDTVYFGTYSGETVPWYVWDSSGLLLSQYLLGKSPFKAISSGYYSTSDLKTAMESRYAAIFPAGAAGAPAERDAIADTTLTGASMYLGQTDLAGQKLFPLAFSEVPGPTSWYGSKMRARYIDDKSGSVGLWWLRSFSDSIYIYYAGNGLNTGARINNFGVRPAFHLDLTKVLFTSAATGGKASGPAGAGALKQNLAPSGATGWKLTLLDSGRSGFAASLSSGSSATVAAGGSVAIDYSGAQTGANEYVSAMLVNSGGSVLCYGRVVNNSASGTAQKITIPAGLSAGTYTLKIFNEQFNGDNTGGVTSNAKTDYASNFSNITLTVNGAGGADVPKTGDRNTPLLWLGLALLAGAGFAGKKALLRKREKN